jgi:3-isopropylmalate dehydratase small subunit
MLPTTAILSKQESGWDPIFASILLNLKEIEVEVDLRESLVKGQRHQQLKNEANKMAMKILFFHRDDKEDLLKIKEMIRRFENSTNTVGLANSALDQFFSIFY